MSELRARKVHPLLSLRHITVDLYIALLCMNVIIRLTRIVYVFIRPSAAMMWPHIAIKSVINNFTAISQKIANYLFPNINFLNGQYRATWLSA